MNKITTPLYGFTLRFATEQDVDIIFDYIIKLGTYQKMIDKVSVTKESLTNLLKNKEEEAVIIEFENSVVGVAVFYMFANGFFGYRCMFLDIFYIDSEMRGKGIGKVMMEYLSRLAIDRGCARLEWFCLNWNTPSRMFYKKLGASEIETMNTFRLSNEALEQVAADWY